MELVVMAPPGGVSPEWAFVPVTAPGLNTLYHAAEHPAKIELPVVPSIKAQIPDPPFGSLPLQPAREEQPKGGVDQRKSLEELLRAWKREGLGTERK